MVDDVGISGDTAQMVSARCVSVSSFAARSCSRGMPGRSGSPMRFSSGIRRQAAGDGGPPARCRQWFPAATSPPPTDAPKNVTGFRTAAGRFHWVFFAPLADGPERPADAPTRVSSPHLALNGSRSIIECTMG